MKKIATTFFFLVFIAGTVSASVKTSVVDGNWSNPATWSPVGVPFMEDTLIINSHVIADSTIDIGINWLIINSNDSLTGDSIFALHGNLINDGVINLWFLAVGDGSITINNGLIKGNNYATGNTSYDNFGTIESDTLNTSETPFINYGWIDNQMISTSGDFDNRGVILVSGIFSQSGTFTNKTGAGINAISQLIISGTFTNQNGGIIVTGSLTTSSLLTNDGDVSCDNWTHGAGTVNGTIGKFCVAMCFVNNATISGTIDICDATPGGFCDFNFGSIAPSVTYCVASPCNTNVGLNEIEKKEVISIYPNPVRSFLNIETEIALRSIEIFDLTGKLVMKPLKNTEKINVEGLDNGVYFVKIETLTWSKFQKIIKE